MPSENGVIKVLSMVENIRLTIAVMIFTIVFIIVLSFEFTQLWHSNRSAKVSASIVKVNSCTKVGMTNSCNLQISYVVGGKSYSADNFNVMTADPAEVGKQIPVYYDPKDPSKVSSIYIPPKKTLGLLAITGFFITGFFFVVKFLFKSPDSVKATLGAVSLFV